MKYKEGDIVIFKRWAASEITEIGILQNDSATGLIYRVNPLNNNRDSTTSYSIVRYATDEEAKPYLVNQLRLEFQLRIACEREENFVNRSKDSANWIITNNNKRNNK